MTPTLKYVHGDLLDLALLIIAVGFGISGYRQGFVVGLLSFVGFVGGAVIGAEFGPAVARALVSGQDRQNQQAIAAFILVFVLAIAGQFVFAAIGQYLKEQLRKPSSARLDAIGGAGVSVLSLLLIAWALGSVLSESSTQGIVRQINDSAVLATMDKAMPSQATNSFTQFRQLLATAPSAEVLSGFAHDQLFPVSAPDPGVLRSAGYVAAKSRVVRITGVASSCDLSIEGSGFPISRDHIMSNAHVVAGVNQDLQVHTQDGRTLNATVVFYDPQVDISVLYVPNLDLAPLTFTTSAVAGDSAVVAGFPGGSTALVQQPARIAAAQDIQGHDIYRAGEIDRFVYQIRAVVEPGNSGGPLLSPDGTVYGVTFASVNSDTGLALTASEVAQDASEAENQTIPTPTGTCDVDS